MPILISEILFNPVLSSFQIITDVYKNMQISLSCKLQREITLNMYKETELLNQINDSY